jgi:hypothetical protein
MLSPAPARNALASERSKAKHGSNTNLMKGSLSERSDLNSIHVIAEEVYLNDYQQKHSKQLVT